MQEKAAIKKRMKNKLMMSYVNMKTNMKGLGGLMAANKSSTNQVTSVYEPKDGKEDEVCDSAEGTDDEEEVKKNAPDPFKGLSSEVIRVLTDPWNQFLLEISYLRDYFVENSNHSIKNSDDKKNQNFLTMHNYQHNFLSDFNRKYELKSPTIIHFFKSRFEYSLDLDIPKDPELIDCYRGFDPV